jgi:hypothetical protein
MSSVTNAFNPLGNEAGLVQALSPTILDPFVQHATNQSWTGRALKPEGFPGGATKPESEQFFKNAPPAAIAIARFLNSATGGDKVTPGYVSVSPEILAHYADAANSYITGGAGKTALQVAQGVAGAVRGEAPDIRNVPVVNRFVYQETPGLEGQRFRQNMDELDTLWNRYTTYRKEGKSDAIKQLPVELLRARRKITPIEAQISAVRDAVKRHPDKAGRADEIVADLQARANRVIAEARQASGLPPNPQ